MNFKVAKLAMTILRALQRPANTGTEYPGCNEPPDMAGSYPVIMEGEEHSPLNGEPRIQDGGDNGDNGDNHGNAIVAGDDGHGVNHVDPGAIVDGVLADLPEPSRHHIFPEVEEYTGAGLAL